ncbi:MAG: haloacid dehalogenase type II [Akkermansiaceae bacterium]
MKRKPFKPFLGSIIRSATVITAALLTLANGQTTTPKTTTMQPTPKVLILDVNETLLDLAPLKTSVGKALGGREDLLPLWFSTMLHYSLVETLSGNYHDFGEIGTAALMMVAKTKGITISKEDATKSIVTPLRSLPAHPDVAAGLKALADKGYIIVSLTNSSSIGVATQLKNAGLTDLVEKRYSVDKLKKYKPHPAPYQMVLDDLGVEAKDVLMVAAHAWDLAGAKNAGLQTAFIHRPGKTLYPNVAKPDLILKDFTELSATLPKRERAEIKIN